MEFYQNSLKTWIISQEFAAKICERRKIFNRAENRLNIETEKKQGLNLILFASRATMLDFKGEENDRSSF